MMLSFIYKISQKFFLRIPTQLAQEVLYDCQRYRSLRKMGKNYRIKILLEFMKLKLRYSINLSTIRICGVAVHFKLSLYSILWLVG